MSNLKGDQEGINPRTCSQQYLMGYCQCISFISTIKLFYVSCGFCHRPVLLISQGIGPIEPPDSSRICKTMLAITLLVRKRREKKRPKGRLRCTLALSSRMGSDHGMHYCIYWFSLAAPSFLMADSRGHTHVVAELGIVATVCFSHDFGRDWSFRGIVLAMTTWLCVHCKVRLAVPFLVWY